MVCYFTDYTSGIVALAIFLLDGNVEALIGAIGYMLKGFYDLRVRLTTDQGIR